MTPPVLSETAVTSRLRLEAANHDVLLWRNNIGAASENKTGRTVRFGLANESKAMNRELKSSDFIGMRRVIITPGMVGQTVGVFIAREVKPSDWKETGKGREKAQRAFIDLVNAYGGDACFASGKNTF